MTTETANIQGAIDHLLILIIEFFFPVVEKSLKSSSLVIKIKKELFLFFIVPLRVFKCPIIATAFTRLLNQTNNLVKVHLNFRLVKSRVSIFLRSWNVLFSSITIWHISIKRWNNLQERFLQSTKLWILAIKL